MEAQNKAVRRIKKYANRKLYDMAEKRYVTFDDLAELIKSGEEIAVEDNETGEDITASIIAQLLAREKEQDNEISSGILIQLLRKGGGTFINYARKCTDVWQNTLTMAEDEIDRLANFLIKEKKLSKSEGSMLKRELSAYANHFKSWISQRVDQQVKDMMKKMNLATREEVAELTAKIESLNHIVEKLEKTYGAGETTRQEDALLYHKAEQQDIDTSETARTNE